jgi:hypothetical protein
MNAAPEALAVVQSGYAAFNRGDISAVVDQLANDVGMEIRWLKGIALYRHVSTQNGMAKFFASILEV